MNFLCAMRLAEAFSLYVIAKAGYEMYKTWETTRGDGVEGSKLHANQHIAAMFSIIFYNAYDIFSFVWFEHMNSDATDYTISFFNLIFLNYMLLIVIDHFKQERVGAITKSGIKELFKF